MVTVTPVTVTPVTAPRTLSGIVQLLSPGPPRLSAIMDRLSAWDDIREFRGLITEYLPELLDEISSEPSLDEQVIRFGHEFAQRYFPINDLEDLQDVNESLCTLIQHGIQIVPYGSDLEDLHEIWEMERPARAILITMAQPPEYYRQYFEGDGCRVAWLESASQHLPEQTLMRIPPGGIPIRTIEDTTRGTPLETIGETLAWAYRNTGNIFLHMTHDEEYYESLPPWDAETVKSLREEWTEAQEILDGMGRLEDWLEADLPGRFPQVLNFILDRAKLLPPGPGPGPG